MAQMQRGTGGVAASGIFFGWIGYAVSATADHKATETRLADYQSKELQHDVNAGQEPVGSRLRVLHPASRNQTVHRGDAQCALHGCRRYNECGRSPAAQRFRVPGKRVRPTGVCRARGAVWLRAHRTRPPVLQPEWDWARSSQRLRRGRRGVRGAPDEWYGHLVTFDVARHLPGQSGRPLPDRPTLGVCNDAVTVVVE